MKDLSKQEKVYEATLEENFAELINSNSPVDNGVGRKICNFCRDELSENATELTVAKGFPSFLFEVDDFVTDYYLECIDKKKLDISDDEFRKYVVWKTFQNKLWLNVFDEVKEEYKKRPREMPFIYSQNETVRELVDMATAKDNLYKATGKTKQVQLSLTEQSASLQSEATNKISLVVENLCSKFNLGVISEQELTSNLTKSAKEILIEGYNKIHDTLQSEFQEKLSEITQYLPMSNNKQLTGEQ